MKGEFSGTVVDVVLCVTARAINGFLVVSRGGFLILYDSLTLVKNAKKEGFYGRLDG